MLEETVRKKYANLTRLLIRNGITITTMESCTAGQIASLITDTEGASEIMKGAFVTYGNEAKIRQGVPAEVIARYGVYSKETATAMAEACRKAYGADIGVGVTGSFRNADPENSGSVPGEVYVAIAMKEKTVCFDCTIPSQPSRYAYKLCVADSVADRLLAILRSFEF